MQKPEDGNIADDIEPEDRLAAEPLHNFKVSVLVNLASAYFAAGDVTQVLHLFMELCQFCNQI